VPEMRYAARWPDGAVRTYYSPSLVVADYLERGRAYALPEFVERSRTALRIASERVRAKYGFACPRAADSLAEIERTAAQFAAVPGAMVAIEQEELS
jgi:uncharacterized repeat protein (TIGR04042 family)